jgi:spermidine/putrescine transport system ATP-binding protein
VTDAPTTTAAAPAETGVNRGPAVRLERLRRTFGDIVAVDDLTLEIPEGAFFSLIGPSGCGKTTTLRMLAGLEEYTSGCIYLHGRDVGGIPPHKRPVSTVFQQYALFPHLSVFENVAFGLRERKVGRAEIGRRVGEMLELVGLTGRETVRPDKLSGGQQQRVALARSLVLEPELLLLDEPLGALDLKLRRQMQMLLKRVQRQVGITFVYVTHDQEEAFSMSDSVAVMNGGLLEQVGRPQEVYRRPATLFVADFVGSANRLPGRITTVLGDGRYQVDLDGIGTVVVPGVPRMATNRDVVAIVRPEAMRPAADGESGPVVSGTVRDVAFLGPQTSYVIENATGGTVTVSVPFGGETSADEPGAERRFTWRPEAGWLLPADGGQ